MILRVEKKTESATKRAYRTRETLIYIFLYLKFLVGSTSKHWYFRLKRFNEMCTDSKKFII